MKLTDEIKSDQHTYLRFKTLTLYSDLNYSKNIYLTDESEDLVTWVIVMFDWLELAYGTLRDQEREQIERVREQYYCPFFTGFHYESEHEYYELKNKILGIEVRPYSKFETQREFDRKVMMPNYTLMLYRFEYELRVKNTDTLSILKAVLKIKQSARPVLESMHELGC